jgi:chemotaxis protein CheX
VDRLGLPRLRPELASAAAEAMFAAEPGSLSADEVSDALGELTNMIGGNIKSLLPAPSRLSVPSVAEGESYTVRIPGARLLESVVLVCSAGPLHIALWKVGP